MKTVDAYGRRKYSQRSAFWRMLRPAGRHAQTSLATATQGPLGWSAARIAQRLQIPIFSGFHTNFHSYSEHYRLGWLEPMILRYLRMFHNRTRGTLVPSDDLAVLYVGRLAPEKNLNLAIQAYRAMQQSNTTTTLKFILVGDGPLSTRLQKDHPDLVSCGVQTGEQLAAYYASADIFLFPSHTETFGNVTLEAMASGLAVVAYDYAAAKMHITHNKTGVLVP